MTRAEALRAAVEIEDESAIRTLLADLSESDRVELLPVGRDLVATQTKKGLSAVGHLAPMLLVAYGVLPASEIRKLGWRSNHLPKQLQDVLRGRAPARLIPIVEYLLDDVGAWAWPIVRPLVREERVPRPDRPSYTIAMLAATRRRGAADLVAEDPALLDAEVWRLFEVEGGGEDSLANHEKFFGDSWGKLFRDLARRDPPMRQRLLDASLAALSRDFATYRAGWFSRFHESLDPSDDERAQRADAYLGLLRSRVSPTVSFAVAALTRIDRAGRLPAAGLLDRIGPVLIDGPAGTVKAALGLVGRVGTGTPGVARRAATVAADALANPSPEVQRSALGIIGALAVEGDEQVARAIVARVPEVAASQRPAAAGLIARLGGDGGASIPPPSAVGNPVASPARDSPPLDPARAIEPVTSVEMLIDVAVSVLETGEPADDVERVLDAVGRLATDRSAPFVRLTAAIAKRSRTTLDRRESRPFSGFDPRADVAGVLLAWAGGEVVQPAVPRVAGWVDPDGVHHPVPNIRSADPGAGAFLSTRAREVAESAGLRRPFISVAAPTHAGGWIDPAVLVGRIEANQPASRLDLVAGLLRLAPDGRDAARHAAAGLAGEPGAVVRYALGGDEVIGPTAAWWVAAARVRAPGADDPAVERRHPGLGPDAGLAARTMLRVRDPRPYFGGIGLEIEPPLPDDVSVDLPTVLMLRSPLSFSWTGRSEPAMLRWMATIQPGYREAWAAAGTVPIARNLDWWSAEWANRAFLEPFVEPASAIGPHGQTLIGIALGAKEAGERGLATDIVRLALADGRLTAATLAASLSASAAAACDRPNRWAVSLADVAVESPGHAASVAEAIARSVPAIAARPPAKLVPLLRLLDELLAGAGKPAADEGRAALGRLVTAGGQAGRLARSILSRG